MPDDDRRRALEELADRTPVPLEHTAQLAGRSEGVLLIAEMVQGLQRANESVQAEASPALFHWGALRVQRFLGEGSYGEVYAAWDPALHREVALKLRRASARGLGSSTLRWLDEARNLAKVRHPNVLTIHGANLHDNRAGMWTELVHGHTLETLLLANGPLPPAEVARIGRDVCAALVAVHAAGLVHGDIKTSNVMVEDAPVQDAGDGNDRARVVLMDFGSAHQLSLEDTPLALPSIGTPLAMAPEVVRGGAVTPAADLYSVGVLLFRLLTARYPIEAASLDALAAAHASGRRSMLDAADVEVPAALAAIVNRALSVNPAARGASALEMRRALADVADPPTLVQRFARPLAALTAVIALAGALFAAYAWWSHVPDENSFDAEAVPLATMPALLHAVREYRGSHFNELVGDAAVCVGDINGDGCDDHAVDAQGYPAHFTFAGRLLLHQGGDRDSILWSQVGDGPSFGLGSRVALARDLDGDGLPDLVVGVGGETDSSLGPAGSFRVFPGTAQGFAPTASLKVLAPQPGWNFGCSIASAGDVDGDGFTDLIVGADRASGEREHAGVALLYRGGPHGLIPEPAWRHEGDQARSACGRAVAGIGDVNGDGYADVAVSTVWERYSALEQGRVEIFLGGARGLSAKPALVIRGSGEAAHLGNSIVPLGDINGDGIDDYAVGEVGFTGSRYNQGRALVFLGSRTHLSDTPYWSLAGHSSNAEMGSCLACPGDVDGDGVADLLVGEGEYRSVRDGVPHAITLLFSGKHLGGHAPPLWTFTGPRGTMSWPQWLAPAGDADGDGRGDVLISNSFERHGGENAGTTRLFVTGGVRRAAKPSRWPAQAGALKH